MSGRNSKLEASLPKLSATSMLIAPETVASFKMFLTGYNAHYKNDEIYKAWASKYLAIITLLAQSKKKLLETLLKRLSPTQEEMAVFINLMSELPSENKKEITAEIIKEEINEILALLGGTGTSKKGKKNTFNIENFPYGILAFITSDAILKDIISRFKRKLNEKISYATEAIQNNYNISPGSKDTLLKQLQQPQNTSLKRPS